MKRKIDFICCMALSCLTATAGELKLEIQRHTPFNLFDTDEVVRFDVKPVGTLPEAAEATVSLKNESGREVARRTVYDISGNFEVNLGKPGNGYFDLEITVGEGGYDPAEQSLRSIDDLENLDPASLKTTSARISLGVVDVVDHVKKGDLFMVHANAVRRMDGSEYLGTLHLGPGVEAFAFDLRGENVLVLRATDRVPSGEQPGEKPAGKRIEVKVEVGDAPVLLTELTGRKKILKPENGKVKIKVEETPVYLSGFGDGVLADVRKESDE